MMNGIKYIALICVLLYGCAFGPSSKEEITYDEEIAKKLYMAEDTTLNINDSVMDPAKKANNDYYRRFYQKKK